MKIFITGSRGFLGQHLCRALEAAGHKLTAPSSSECDLRSADSLTRFSGEKFDQIFHLAAWTQAGDFCLHHPGEQWIANQQLNTNVLSWWQSAQPQAKLIAIGTSCVYEPDTPHIEENFLRGMPIDSLFTYAMTKRMLYTGLLALNRQFGLRYLMLVPSTLYGPDYHTDGRQMHFIFDLMRKIANGKYRGEPVVLWGDGSQKRELVFIDDFVRAALLLADRNDNELVNIGGGVEYSIRYFAEQICSIIGFDPAQIQYDTTKYVGATSKFLVVEKLLTLIPEFSFTPLEAGLKRTVEWYERVTFGH